MCCRTPQATLDFHQTSINQDVDAEIEDPAKDFDAILCNSDVLAYKPVK